MNKLKISLINILIIASALSLWAQSNVPILITGHIKFAGTPIGTDLRIVDADGKDYQLKSNKDGTYQQVLNSGKEYNVFFEGYLLDNKANQINIAASKDYKELTYDFNVVKLDAGLELANLGAFESNQSKLSNKAINELNNLKELTKSQRAFITFDFIIKTNDNNFKVKSEKVKVEVKGKSKTKTVKLSVDAQRQKLFAEREEELYTKLAELKINKRNVNIIHDNSPMPKATKSKSKSKNNTITDNNLIIKINKVSKL
ncbi:MAG TPA: hypothetical protein PLE30_09065 [Candidatus Kapabacteria bacterium]|nr:hypothetical protein [Candidatus Kapabacteria bacterium]